jgi:protein-S-isoprenylcysteine O-methyltransferase Ste14
MLSPSIDRRTLLSQLGTALLLGAGFGIGLWLWVTQGARFAGVVLAVTILSGIVWQYRVYAARRWHALMDAYAEREMAQRQRR